jgi:hypothetical protein
MQSDFLFAKNIIPSSVTLQPHAIKIKLQLELIDHPYLAYRNINYESTKIKPQNQFHVFK